MIRRALRSPSMGEFGLSLLTVFLALIVGGLAMAVSLTFITFLIGCIAIAGIPPFSGFFSKDAILLAAYVKNPVLYGVALFGSLMTAFYMFWLLFIASRGTFCGTVE